MLNLVKSYAMPDIPKYSKVYNGLERSVPLSLGYKARLIDPVDKFDNTSVRPTFLLNTSFFTLL